MDMFQVSEIWHKYAVGFIGYNITFLWLLVFIVWHANDNFDSSPVS